MPIGYEKTALDGLKGRVQTIDNDLNRYEADLKRLLNDVKWKRHDIAAAKDMKAQYAAIVEQVERSHTVVTNATITGTVSFPAGNTALIDHVTIHNSNPLEAIA